MATPVRIELRRDAGRIGPESGPWIRRNQIARMLGIPDPHVLAMVVDRKGEPMAWGLVSAVSTITVRLLGWGAEPPPDDWLERRLAQAFAARSAFGFEQLGTTGYRLVNSEGDGLPGLVVDRYGDDLVVQLGTAPMAAREQAVLDWLRTRWHGAIHTLVPEGAARSEGIEATPRDDEPSRLLAFTEHHLRFEVPAPPAQKTGAYFDQRANRRTIAQLAKHHGGPLLDLGCHVGGFALHARKTGIDVVALDRSRTVLELAAKNESANGLSGIGWIEADMFERLAAPQLAGPFGTIVVDPPRIASKKSDVERAQGAMGRIVNELAPRLLPDGFLVLCSCSHHLGREHLDRILVDARFGWARILALGAGIDHPVAPGHREGEYLRVNVYQRRDGTRLTNA